MISHLGRYEIQKELGRGSMGIVYRANDPVIGRRVAVKTINLQGLTQKKREEYEARFYQEAKAAGMLNHPNIVTVHDMGESGDIAYIAMELLEGRELHSDSEEMQSMPLMKALDIAIQVANGLAYAHDHGVVHRDIKPSNIMVLGDGQVKIADFGIAKMDASLMLTRTGAIMGSPLYMSPEQILSGHIDSRSDVFSFGIVLYQMLTGQRPFRGDDANSVMYQIVNVTPPRPGSLKPGLPDMIDDIVMKCLEKKPQDRYQDSARLADDLRACRLKLESEKAALGHPNLLGVEWNRMKRLVIPGGLPQGPVAVGAFLSLLVIFMLDIMTGGTVQMHLLYIFPLVMAATHLRQTALVYAVVALSLLFQSAVFASYSTHSALARFILALLVLPSNVFIAYVARIARINYQEVVFLAAHDSLTGLHNRLSFEAQMEKEISLQKRNGGVFSFAFIDIDNLRELNEAKGEKAGDDALRILAGLLKEQVRHSDTAARLGGDEFAVLMPGTKQAECTTSCETIAETITTSMAKSGLPLTCSIGYVTVETPPGSISEVISRAEKAMHAAQSMGKGMASKG